MSAPGRRRLAARPRPRAALCALAFAIVLAVPATASAGSDFSSAGSDPYGSAPGGQSAGDQYVETLPTTKGPRAPGNGKRARKLARGVDKKLQRQGGSDAASLEALATSTALGAPVDEAKGSQRNGAGQGRSQGKRAPKGKRHGDSTPAVPSAAINAVDGAQAGLGWLVIGLLAITALALGAVAHQRHRDKDSAG